MREDIKKIGFFSLESWERDIVKPHFPKTKLYFDPRRISVGRQFTQTDFDALCVFVDSPVNQKTLKNFPKVKFVTTRSTGYDHIDLESCRKQGIVVSYVPGYGDNTVAEFAFSLLLNLTRKTYQGIDRVKRTGNWSYENLRGTDLKGKTLGVVGTGRIGREAIKIGIGFGMSIVAFDPAPDKKLAKNAPLRYLSLPRVLAASDAVTIHTPYNENTHHLINDRTIRNFKRGAYLINTARGGIVATGALIHALRSGILAGAGLDVLEEEGVLKNDGKTKNYELLRRMPNVLITPHNAFNTQEAAQRILQTTIQNLQAFLRGHPINAVTK